MARNLRLRTKLLLSFVLLGVVAIGVTGWWAYQSARQALEEATRERLTAIRETKRREIEDYFAAVRNHVVTVAESPVVVGAMRELSAAFEEVEAIAAREAAETRERDDTLRRHYEAEYLPRLRQRAGGEQLDLLDRLWPRSAATRFLQYHYVAANPHPVGSKDALDAAAGAGWYGAVHARYHRLLRDFQRRYGFYDVFLIDPAGNIVYTAFKELDFATNLGDGPYRDTNLAAVFRAARDGHRVTMVDFDSYDPSYGMPASFIAAPIGGDRPLGVVAFQIPVDELNRAMTGDWSWSHEGFGRTGEAYLVGADFKMRSDARVLIEASESFLAQLSPATPPDVVERIRRQSTTILNQEVRTEAVRAALGGAAETRLGVNYRGVPVLTSYTPLRLPDVRWALVSEIGETEALASARRLGRSVLLIAAVVAGSFALMGLWLARTITGPLSQLTDATREVARGNLAQRIAVASGDEIGALAASFNEMTKTLQETTVTNEELERQVAARTRELHERQAQLVQSEKMAALGTLAAGVAHEINTPLGALKSNNDVVGRCVVKAREALGGDGEAAPDRTRLDRLFGQVEQLTGVSRMACDRILTIVASLRGFTRLDRAERDRADLHEGLDSTLTLLQHELKRGVTVHREYGQLPRVDCFPNKLNQVFMNVLLNAVHAVAGRGDIFVRTYRRDASAVVEIRDTGPGIPEDVRPRIFDPGYTTKGVGIGTGLGLAISHQIMTEHRGRIEVESELGVGTTMRLVLPI